MNKATPRRREEQQKQKVQLHRQHTANLATIQKSQAITHFVDVMNMWRPNTLLYRGKSTQAVYFEELKDRKKGMCGLLWKHVIGKLLAFWILQMLMLGFYLFCCSHKTYHREIETRSIGEELQSKLEEIIQFGQDNGVDVHVLLDAVGSIRNHFLKVAHHDSTIYRHLAEDMKFDQVWMVKKLLEMQKIKHPCVKVDKERGTLNISLGFAHKRFNYNFAPDKANTTTPMPAMMYCMAKDVLELYVTHVQST